MRVPFACAISMGVKCYQCGEMGDAGSALYPIGQEVCRPVLPDGWHTFDGWPVCPKHRVVVEDMNAATVRKEP